MYDFGQNSTLLLPYRTLFQQSPLLIFKIRWLGSTLPQVHSQKPLRGFDLESSGFNFQENPLEGSDGGPIPVSTSAGVGLSLRISLSNKVSGDVVLL